MKSIRLHDGTTLGFSLNPSSRLSLILLILTFVAFFCIMKLEIHFSPVLQMKQFKSKRRQLRPAIIFGGYRTSHVLKV